jgi:hypothetical protein
MQLLPGENNNSSEYQTSDPVDRRNQILLTSQSPGETTSEILLVMESP